MNNLNNANLKKLNNALDREYNFLEFGISTFRNMINENKFIRVEQKEIPKIQFNRVKYNRMNGKQQKEYDILLNEKKIEYRFYYNDFSFIVVPKTIFDYYNKIKEV